MKRFNICAGIKKETGLELQELRNLRFETVEEALTEAEDFAKEIYYLNPTQDILELQAEGLNEVTAKLVFERDMANRTVYYVEEIIEIGDEIEIVQHRKR